MVKVRSTKPSVISFLTPVPSYYISYAGEEKDHDKRNPN